MNDKIYTSNLNTTKPSCRNFYRG